MNKEFLLYLTAKVVKGIAPFIFLPIVFNYIDSASYGRFAYYEAIILLLAQTVLFGAHQVVSNNFKNYCSKELFKKSTLFVFINTLFLFLLVLILKWLFDYEIEYSNFFICIISIYLFAQSLLSVNMMKLKSGAKSLLVYESISSISRYIIALVFLAFVLKTYFSLLIGFTASLIILNLFIAYNILTQETSGQTDIKIIDFYRPGKMIFFYSIGAYVISFSDRLMLENLGTTTDLGIYSMGYKIATVIQVLNLSYVSSKISEIYSKDDFSLSRYLNLRYFRNISLSMMAIIIIGYFYISWFLPSEMMSSFSVLVIISIAFVFNGITSFYYHNFCRVDLQKFTALIAIIGAVLNIALNYYFIPFIGINGAAIATLLCYVIMTLMYALVLKKNL